MSKILYVISPSLNALVDKKKGTSGNKIDCAFKHFGNAVKYNTAMGLTAGVASAIGCAKLAKSNPGMLHGSSLLKKAWEGFKAAPKPVKIAAGAIIGLFALLRTHNAGRIEQKYLDRAQFVDHTFSLDGEGVKPEK